MALLRIIRCIFGLKKPFYPQKQGKIKKKCTFLKNFSRNVCKFKKKPYLCIAFETRDIGRLAQLVQSICLTSRGSAVRIRQRPLEKTSLLIDKEFRAFSSAGSEHLPYKQRVGGSNPSTPTEILKTFTSFGRLAQLVQSICLTSRGSAVRIRQRPPKELTSRSGAVGSSLGS